MSYQRPEPGVQGLVHATREDLPHRRTSTSAQVRAARTYAEGNGVELTSSGFSPLAQRPESAPMMRRFPRSRTCTGSAEGTRTHGRRIMSPLGILAALADQRSSMTLSQVRMVTCVDATELLSVCSYPCVPNVSPMNPQAKQTEGFRDDRASSWTDIQPARSGVLFQRAWVMPPYPGRSPRHLGTRQLGPRFSSSSRPGTQATALRSGPRSGGWQA